MNTQFDLIGPAARISKIIDRAIEMAKPTGAPLSFLFHGKPGVGKSRLADYFVQKLGASKWSIQRYSGTQMKIDVVEDIARSMHYTDMFGGYKVVHIEEADYIPAIAQVRFLMLMDDMPRNTAIVCTCNSNLSELEDRFQRRFQCIEVKGPLPQDIAKGLVDNMQLPEKMAIHIAELSCGNVGQAIMDAKTYLNTH